MDQDTKARTNVSIDADLLRQARARGINLSASLEDTLRRKLARARQEEWLAENREAIEATHRFLEEHGLWSDGLRRF